MKHSNLDHLIINFDHALRTVLGRPLATSRPNPAKDVAEQELSAEEKQLSAALMRVNHAGEVAAQGLYQGQALTAHKAEIREVMQQSALEENDHLVWCEERIKSMGSHVSYLSPVWYLGSFVIGAAAGVAGDKWSLGFVAETEKQVVEHIDHHLISLPANDEKSRTVLQQMREDEEHHATVAVKQGGVPLPSPVPSIMKQVAKVMTKTAFWI